MGGVTGTSDSYAEGSERRMKNCVEKTLMKFGKTKFKVLHLRTCNPVNQYMLRTDQLEITSSEQQSGGPGGQEDEHEPTVHLYSNRQQTPGLH